MGLVSWVTTLDTHIGSTDSWTGSTKRMPDSSITWSHSCVAEEKQVTRVVFADLNSRFTSCFYYHQRVLLIQPCVCCMIC
jgi:hypothetical protein